MAHMLSDFSPGPLDFYRKKASFDWKTLKVFIDTEDGIQYEKLLCDALRSHPEYQTEFLSQTLDEKRRVAARRALALQNLELGSMSTLTENLKRVPVFLRTLAQLSLDSSAKESVGNGMFSRVVRSLGTDRHSHILEMLDDGLIHGCFCLTEVGHGSNINGMRTTATYNKEKQTFVMHSPDFEAAKCWVGGLGQGASYAIVYAQLYVDGVHYGLHTFVVPVRDPKTLIPYPGVIVGDMGEKIGLNGIDNGFMLFDNYYIPRENILNRNADVTPEGKYVTRFKSSRDRYGANLGALSAGRVYITGICEYLGTKALTVAVRYAAVRKQFGPDGQDEIPILEYQSHQHRLLPYLAAVYVLRFFSSFLIETTYQFNIDLLMGQNKELLPLLGMEIHVVSSASKPVAGWLMRDAIQECREACGGHGYLKASGIGDVRNDHDANCTYEGDNHVLIQQTSNWLLKQWPLIENGERISTPMKSANFLSNFSQILKHKFTANTIEEVCYPKTIIDAYQWLVCYLLKEAKYKFDSLIQQNGDEFTAKNDTQVFYAKSLSTAFIQHFFLQHMLLVIDQASHDNVKNVLLKLFSLYGLFTLEKFLATLYEGDYAQGPKLSYLVHEGMLMLCRDIKDDAVALIDAVAPPDFILNSVLGASDGQVYKHLQSSFFRNAHSMCRPVWWKEFVNWNSSVKCKI